MHMINILDSNSEAKLARMVEVLKAIAHPVRLGIIILLCQGKHNVSEMAEALRVRQSTVSQHLNPLRLLGLVTVDRTGGKGTYSLQEPSLKELVRCLAKCKDQ